VVARLHVWANALWLALVSGAGFGFVARDLLEMGQPGVTVAWTAGALLGAAAPRCRGPRAPRRARRWGRGPAVRDKRFGSELGQSTVEWAGLVALVALAFGALLTFGPRVDGRPFGGFLVHRLVCAAKGGCRDGDRALVRAYADRAAELVRAHAPNLVYERGEPQLPVDWRRCRRPMCASAPDDPDLDAHRGRGGTRATVFTSVLRRGGHTFIQYWLYYPDSNTSFAGADKAWEASWLLPRIRELVQGTGDWPGFHKDDWESYQVRLDPDGSAWVRASSHGHYQGCQAGGCRNRWTPETGWTRVSRGSHAGHIPVRAGPGGLRPVYPGPELRERTSTSEGLRLIPLETLDRSGYRRLDEDVAPPWRKEAYRDPTSDES
jgi:hypothetical protein